MRYRKNKPEGVLPWLIVAGAGGYLGYEFILKPMLEGSPEETLDLIEKTAPVEGRPVQMVPGISPTPITPVIPLITDKMVFELTSIPISDPKNTAFAYKKEVANSAADSLRRFGIPANVTSTSMLYVVVERAERDRAINHLRNIGINEVALKVPTWRVPVGFRMPGFTSPAFAGRFWTDREVDEAIRQIDGIGIRADKARVGMHYISVSSAHAKNVWSILNETNYYEPKTGLLFQPELATHPVQEVVEEAPGAIVEWIKAQAPGAMQELLKL